MTKVVTDAFKTWTARCLVVVLDEITYHIFMKAARNFHELNFRVKKFSTVSSSDEKFLTMDYVALLY